MHLARFRRHGSFERKTGSHGREKLPHDIDPFILEHCRDKEDEELARILQAMGYQGATQWTVKYRRRKLGVRKYEYGEVKKHKAWIRTQAIRTYGAQCELCGFSKALDVHHVVPKFAGGLHHVDNLMVVCPNCHALITRGHLNLRSRVEIPTIRQHVLASLRVLYQDLI